MPKEIREIIFSPEEFREAASAYLQRQAGHDIAGELIDIALTPGNALSAFAEFTDKENNVTVKVRLGATELGALLTLYCMSQNIPLPKKAERSVQAVGDSIALMITIEGPRQENDIRDDADKAAIAS